MHNWGPRPKTIPSEAGDITKSMVMWLILTKIWMTILELIWGRLCNECAAWCCINLFRSLKWLFYYHWMKKGSIMEQCYPTSLTAQHETHAQCTLLTTVKWPTFVQSWGRCWPQKAWSWSTDTIQTPVDLIHIHIMHNWGPKPKVILSEAGDATKSMVMSLILTRMHKHSGDDLGEILQ